MRDRIFRLATNRPKTVFISLALLVLGLGAQISRVKVDTDPQNMLPAGQAERVFHNQTRETFSLSDMIVVGVVNDKDPDGVFNPHSLGQIHRLTERIKGIEGVVVRDLMSPSTVDKVTPDGAGTVRFEWLLPEAPKTRAEARALKADALRLPMLRGSLITENGQAVAIYVPIADKTQSHRISQEIKAVFGQLQGAEQYFITGLPVAEDTFGVEMFKQMAISAPMAALVIFAIMWWFFRSVPLITAPMIIAMSTVIITMGALIGSGFTVHIMSSMIPIFLMPIAVVNSIHILSEFSDSYREGQDKREVIRGVVGKLFTPMLYTSLTTVAGFGSLAFAPIPPVKIFGVFVAAGVAVSFLLSVIFIPAYVVSLSDKTLNRLPGSDEAAPDKASPDKASPDEASPHEASPRGLLARLLPPIGHWSVAHSHAVVAVLIVLTGISVYGITRININDNPVLWFRESHELRIADRELNKHFAGTYPAYLVLKKDGDDPTAELDRQVARTLADVPSPTRTAVQRQWASIKRASANPVFEQHLSDLIERVESAIEDGPEDQQDVWEGVMALLERVQTGHKHFQSPEALQYIAKLQRHLDESPIVGKSTSIADIVKTLNRDLHDGSSEHYGIPSSSPAVAQALLTYQSSHRPHDLWHFVSSDMRSASIWVQLKSGDNQDMEAVVGRVNAYLQQNPPPEGVSVRWAGMTYLNVVWQQAMVAGMLNALLGSFAIVLVMMIGLFRSLLFGLLSMIPLSITITFIYGLIGLIGKDYDMPVAVLSAMTLGLSVDFAIHFLQRARNLREQHGEWTAALHAMFKGPGRAITRNAIVIAIGFLPLLAAPLVPYNTVGFFMSAIMGVSGVVTLVLLPAVVHLLRKRLPALRKSDNPSADQSERPAPSPA